MSLPSVQSSSALADRVQRILASRGLSLANLSRASGSNRPGHIPHSFYSSLRKSSFSPSLYQLHSLSRLTGYRLVDWFALFGVSLDNVSRFQVFFPSLRTVEIDPRIYHAQAPLPWLYDLQEADLSTPLAPLSQWVALGSRRKASSISRGEKRTFRYVKIGSHDVLAFPDLLPDSIVRVSNDFSALNRTPIGKTPGRTIFLVRHSKGITCSRLLRSETNTIVLCSRHLPYAPIELIAGAEADVLGAVDNEIRSVAESRKPVVSAALERYRRPSPLSQLLPPRNAGEFIQRARKACGISFREAAERTRVIARALGDSRYYCSPGALSDYETRRFAPRHIHKLISICAVYFASAADLLEACDASLENAGIHAMPREFQNSLTVTRASAREPSRFLREMERRFGQLPYFLRTAGFSMFGSQKATLRDVFWVGNSEEPKYSCLRGIRFLIVDRRQKSPRVSLSCPNWAQPMYVLQKRGGGYLWGFCRLENGALSLCSPAQHAKSVRLRNGIDAEVIGRVVGVIRRLR